MLPSHPPAHISARPLHMQSLFGLAILILPSEQDFQSGIFVQSGTFVIVHIMKSLGLLLLLVSDKGPACV